MTTNQHFWRIFFRTLNKLLTVIFVCCIVFVLLMDMNLLAVNKPIKLFVALGKLNYGVAISYIAAYVFYLITIHFYETKTSISLYQAADFPAAAIVTNIYGIFIEMAKTHDMNLKREELNESKIRDILNSTKCFNESTLSSPEKGFPKYNWVEYINITNNKIKDYYKNLYPIYNKLDGDYISALSNLEQVDFVKPITGFLWAETTINKTNKEEIFFTDAMADILLDLYLKAKIVNDVVEKRRSIYEIKA